MPHYFAYGLLMSPEAMAVRSPRAKLIGIGRLPRHCLLMLVGGRVSIARDPRRVVYGAVFDVPMSDVMVLDRVEGVPAGRAQKLDQPIVLADGAKRALLHLATDLAKPASMKDRERLADAARALGLPDDYQSDIRGVQPQQTGFRAMKQ